MIHLYTLSKNGFNTIETADIESVQDLFKHAKEILASIGAKHHTNLFYRLSHGPRSKGHFESQEVLAWDIDGIDVNRIDEYLSIVCDALNIDQQGVVAVASGHGLHILILLDTPISDKSFFSDYKDAYNVASKKIEGALLAKGLAAKVDTSIFDPARVLRVPGTVNIKPGKEPVLCRVLKGELSPKTNPLELFKLDNSKIEENYSTDYIPTRKVDTDSVLKECGFLVACKSNQQTLPEPEWYAMVSITSRISHELVHEYSRHHPNYSMQETNKKIEQALQVPPRTCSNISTLSSACKSCKHFGSITTPLQIEGDDFIGSLDTGFHDVVISKSGLPRYVPNYKDLQKYYVRKHKFYTLIGSDSLFTFDGHYYKYSHNSDVQAFAQKYFYPTCTNVMAAEFLGLMLRCNKKEMREIEESSHAKINLQNGYYDFKTSTFHETSDKIFFSYVLPYSYDPFARAPNFLNILAKVTMNDELLEKILIEFFGYALSGDVCWIQKALVLVGGGSNGKSTFLSIMRAVIGDKNTSPLTLADIKTETKRNMLYGKLLNVAEETPNYGVGDTAIFKALVGGGEVSARELYKSGYVFRNKTKFVFACNELPENNNDNSDGFFRRFLIVPFEATFSANDADFDPFIEFKIVGGRGYKGELPGIFNILLQGYGELRKRGKFLESEKSSIAKEEYVEDQDVVGTWVKDHLEWMYDAGWSEVFLSTMDIYAAYKLWAEAAGYRPTNLSSFGKRMKAAVPNAKSRYRQRQVDGVRQRGFAGCKLKLGVEKF